MEETRANTFKFGKRFRGFTLENKALFILIVLAITIALLRDTFLTVRNLTNVLRQVCVSCTLGLGFTFVLASGNLDLSVGAMLSLLGVVCAQLSLVEGMPLFVALILTLILGLGLGFLNGFVSMQFHLNPFIVTLASQQMFKGVGYLLCNNTPVAGLSDFFRFVGQGKFFDVIPCNVVIVVVLAIIAFVVLNKTPFGRYCIACGGNREAARVSGVNTKWITISTYMVMGFFAAWGGILMDGRVMSAQPAAGIGMEMDTIAAVVLGGTPMSGGKGKVVGTLIGCLIVGVINNGLNLMQVDSNWQIIAKGVLILAAILIDAFTSDMINRQNIKKRASAGK